MAGINLKSCKPDPPQKQKAFLPNDALRNHSEGPSPGVINTILVAQNQIKDGFLATGQW